MQFLSIAIMGLNVVFNINLFIFFRLAWCTLFAFRFIWIVHPFLTFFKILQSILNWGRLYGLPNTFRFVTSLIFASQELSSTPPPLHPWRIEIEFRRHKVMIFIGCSRNWLHPIKKLPPITWSRVNVENVGKQCHVLTAQ